MKRVAALFLVLLLTVALSLPAAASVPGELLIWSDGERAPVLTEVARNFVAEYGIPV